MKRLFILLFACAFVLAAVPARAQSASVIVVEGTKPISSELHAQLTDYLNANPPSPAQYYAVTYTQSDGLDMLLSLAGLNLQAPDEAWSLFPTEPDEPDKVLWLGTVRLFQNGGGELYTKAEPSHELAALHFIPPFLPALAGGGSQINMPFQSGRKLQISSAGVRAAIGNSAFGTSGMFAMNLVGSTAGGSGVATDLARAADTGTVDYVCDDGTTDAVRTYNSTTGDTFVYARLKPNATMTIGHTYTAFAAIGNMVHGAYADTCGVQVQFATQYQMIWLFKPANGSFQTGRYMLTLSDKKWHTATEAIGAGGWLIGGGGGNAGCTGLDCVEGLGGGIHASFWDGILDGLQTILQGTIFSVLPEHQDPTKLLDMLMQILALFFRMVWVFARGNIDLSIPMLVIAVVILFRLAFSGIYLLFWALRVWRIFKQSFNPGG